MVIIYILYALLTFFTLAAWGIMIFAVIKEWRKFGKFNGILAIVLVTFLASIAIWSLFSSYPF